MTEHHNNLPLDLHRAQLAFWMRTAELLNENRSRWLDLTHHALARDTSETHAETLETTQAPDWTAFASLPMNASWRMLNHGVGNARDLTLTALNNQAALGAGMRRALAQWQLETAQALSTSHNAMPFSGLLASLVGSADLDRAEADLNKPRK
jgi:hypothetical protein